MEYHVMHMGQHTLVDNYRAALEVAREHMAAHHPRFNTYVLINKHNKLTGRCELMREYANGKWAKKDGVLIGCELI